MSYHYEVTTQDPKSKPRYQVLYRGTDAADAMAAWSKAISSGIDYATLEALHDREPPS